MNTNTLTTLRDVFYSGAHAFRGDASSVQDIAFLLDEKYLDMRGITIATKDAYTSLLDELTQDEHLYNEAAGGEIAHLALKLLPGEYLGQERSHAVVYEQPFCGYYPDVCSKDRAVVVECGHTQNPEKILAYFENNTVTECIQVPYPTDEDKTIVGYSFTVLNNELADFLAFLAHERRNDVKELVQQGLRAHC